MRSESMLLFAVIGCGPGTGGPAQDATSGDATGATDGSGYETGWPSECVGAPGGRAPCYRVVRTDIDPIDGIVASVDLDGDTLSDLYDRQQGIWFGKGAGAFGGRLPLAPPGQYGGLVGDLDGDGLGDIVASVHPREVAVYRGTPQGVVFVESVLFEVPTSFGSSLGDFDGDGDLDVLTWDHPPSVGSRTSVQRLHNDGAGSLTPGAIQELESESEPYPEAVADVDGDGADDVVGWIPIMALDPGFYHIVYGGPDVFDGPHVLPGPEIADRHLADVDGDGRADLILSRAGSIEVWHSLGRNDFEPWGETELFTPLDEYSLGSVAWADVDGAGGLDLLVAAVDDTPSGRELALFVLFDPGPGGFGQVEHLTIPAPCPSKIREVSLHRAALDAAAPPDFLLDVGGTCEGEWAGGELVALIPDP